MNIGCAKYFMGALEFDERDNGSDHRVRTGDLPFQNHAQAGLRVHRIVMSLMLSSRYPVLPATDPVVESKG